MVETTDKIGLVDKMECWVHLFFIAVALVYGSGFLIVFTFFKNFGIDDIDFVETKYIHVGFLFFLACLTIIFPLWWVVWVARSVKSKIIEQIREGTLLRTLIKRVGCWCFPTWSIDRTHGLNAGMPVLLSMMILLWSFIPLVTFASPGFSRKHSKLAFLDFIIPITILVIGWLGDLFKEGSFSPRQSFWLKWARFTLRIWWLIAGGSYLFYFSTSDCFEYDLKPLVKLFFVPPLFLITVTFVFLICLSRRRVLPGNILTRIAAFQWALYTTQWAVFISYCWVFIWTIKSGTLGLSLWDVFFGNDYFKNCWGQLSGGDWFETLTFPQGGIYFILFIVIITFFAIRARYRHNQIKTKEQKIALFVSTIGLIVPLFYISIIAFSHFIYPYIPYEKGGGDYSEVPVIYLTFNTNAVTKTGLLINIPPVLVSLNTSNRLVILDENGGYIFLADKVDAKGPANWRNGTDKPAVYEVCREAITCISSGQ